MISSYGFPQTTKALNVLLSLGIDIDHDTFLARIEVFHRLCSTWNLAAKLMSKGDLGERFDEHIADSLTLCPEIQGRPDLAYVDIGSGGGFPALPIAVALGDRAVWLVERSERKSDYLRQALRALDLPSGHVVAGQYPLQLDAPKGRIYTARAVERPEAFDSELIKQLRPGDVYLMQREAATAGVHGVTECVPVHDAFEGSGLRRGKLYRLTR